MRRARLWRWLGLVALGLVLYGVFLLVFAPAAYFARGVALLTRETLTVQQPNGSFWRGHGALALAPAGAPRLGRVHWTIKPWRLLAGSVVVELKFDSDNTDVRGTVALGLRRYAVYDFVGVAPVRAAAVVIPAANVMGLDGRLRFTSAAFEINKDTLHGAAEVLWEGAASRLLPISQTGDYKLQLGGQGKRAELRVSTVQGVLQIAAQGEWRALEDGVLRLQGTIAASPPQAALEPFLNSIGPPQADGRRRFTYETRWPPLRPELMFLL